MAICDSSIERLRRPVSFAEGIDRAVSRPSDLPDFEDPPITEVVLGIQFEDIAGIRHTDLGAVYGIFKDDYPIVTEHQPLSPQFEMFGLPGLHLHPPLRVTFGPPIPRLWFEAPGGSGLLQFQANRLLYNWRKPLGGEYPRYEAVRTKFVEASEKLLAFLVDRKLAPLTLNQCEVTYINIIPIYPTEANASARVFKFWQPVESRSLPSPDDVSFNINHVFKDSMGAPFARLTANAFQGMTGSNAPVIQFGLTVRGFKGGHAISDACSFFDFARDKIVRGFKDLTTVEMHNLWRMLSP